MGFFKKLVRAVAAVNTLGLSEAAYAKQKQKKEKEKLEKEQAAAEQQAHADYYNKIMQERNRQINAYLGTQTNMSQDSDAAGLYGNALGSFGVFGKKKKYY